MCLSNWTNEKMISLVCKDKNNYVLAIDYDYVVGDIEVVIKLYMLKILQKHRSCFGITI